MENIGGAKMRRGRVSSLSTLYRCVVRVGLLFAIEFLGRGLKFEYSTLEAEWAGPR